MKSAAKKLFYDSVENLFDMQVTLVHVMIESVMIESVVARWFDESAAF